MSEVDGVPAQHDGGVAMAIAIGPGRLIRRSTSALVRYSRARTSVLRARLGTLAMRT
jgi:hypothetical protein